MRRCWISVGPSGKGAFGLASLDGAGPLRCDAVSFVDQAAKEVEAEGEPSPT